MLGEILTAAGTAANIGASLFQSGQNWSHQKSMAQHGIQWKVGDAIRSGIHPLYALGAQPFNYSPTSVGIPDIAGPLRDMGQDIDRSIMAHKSASQRAQMIATAQSLERGKLENDKLATEIAVLKGSLPKSVPIPGKGVVKVYNDRVPQAANMIGQQGENVRMLPAPKRILMSDGTSILVRDPGFGSEAESHYSEAADVPSGLLFGRDISTDAIKSVIQMGGNPDDYRAFNRAYVPKKRKRQGRY